mgnify:FL=1|jgi:glutaredoxin
MRATVITQAYCESCTKVKGLLDDYGISFTLCSVDHQGSTELRRLLESQGIRTVPAVFIDKEYIGGLEDTQAFLMESTPDADQYSFGEKLDG